MISMSATPRCYSHESIRFRKDIILDYNCAPNVIILLLKSRDLSSIGNRKSGRAILKQRIPHKVAALKMKGVT